MKYLVVLLAMFAMGCGKDDHTSTSVQTEVADQLCMPQLGKYYILYTLAKTECPDAEKGWDQWYGFGFEFKADNEWAFCGIYEATHEPSVVAGDCVIETTEIMLTSREGLNGEVHSRVTCGPVATSMGFPKDCAAVYVSEGRLDK